MTVISVKKLACNFCGDSEDEAEVMIKADDKGNTCICDKCVSICLEVIEKHKEGSDK